ncbi:MAG: hypothetical protein J0I66_08755, partial [Microbacterium sp.]|nr:hypothetical protein [Microbacterium sp.]
MATRIGIVGASWRGEYFLRAASVLPEHFEVARILTRSEASAARVSSVWGVEATTSLDDFTLVAVADMSEAALERVRAKDDAITTYTSAEEMFAASPTDVVCVSTYA